MGFDLSDYEPVEERLAKFWKDHPYGRVITELLAERHDGEYIVFASIYTGAELKTDPPTATGLASEYAGSTVVNKTSALENCETSAIGRALANMGYAPKGKRPSREEMSKASNSASAQSSTLPAQRTGGGATGPTPPSKRPAADHSGADSQGPEATGEASDVSLGKDLDTKLPRGTYLSKDDQALLRVEFGSPATALKAYRARFGERITRLADITYEMRDEMAEATA